MSGDFWLGALTGVIATFVISTGAVFALIGIARWTAPRLPLDGRTYTGPLPGALDTNEPAPWTGEVQEFLNDLNRQGDRG